MKSVSTNSLTRIWILLHNTGKNAFWSDNEEKRRTENVIQAKESSEGDDKLTILWTQIVEQRINSQV